MDIFLSSALIAAVVAAFVSSMASAVFQHRMYLKKQKLEAYGNYLDQLFRAFPRETAIFEEDKVESTRKFLHEAESIKRQNWQVQLVGNRKVKKLASEITSHFDDILELKKDMHLWKDNMVGPEGFYMKLTEPVYEIFAKSDLLVILMTADVTKDIFDRVGAIRFEKKWKQDRNILVNLSIDTEVKS